MGDDISMSNGPWDEILSWLKEDRVRVAVLASQVEELRRANDDARIAQAAIIARLDAMRDDTRRIVKEALQEHLSSCLAIQRQAIQGKEKESGPDTASIMKHLGAAVAGAGLMVAALWDKLVR